MKSDQEVYRQALRTVGSLMLHGVLPIGVSGSFQVGRTTHGIWLASIEYD